MSHLDPRTVVMVTSALWLACAMILMSMRRDLSTSVQGVGEWAGGIVAMFAASALIGQRDQLPDILTSVIANGLLWWGMAACAVGLCRYAGRKVFIPALLGAGILYVAASMWFVLLQPNYPMRLVTNAFFILLIELLLLQAALSIRPFNRPVKLMAVSHATMVGVAAFRIVAILSDVDKTAGLFDQTIFQKVFLVTFGLSWLIASMAFILVITDRTHIALRHAATIDSLSGLLNRGAVTKLLESEMERSSRHGEPLSILLVDIDHFKQVNDSYGHAAGDRTIADFAGRAKQQLRCSDTLGRYGGEEFLAVLPHTNPTMALQVAERVRTAATGPGNSEFSYTVSVGVAGHRQGMTLEDFVLAADRALYRAKRSGRNRVELADGE